MHYSFKPKSFFLQVVNSSSNFWIYISAGKLFKENLIKLLGYIKLSGGNTEGKITCGKVHYSL